MVEGPEQLGQGPVIHHEIGDALLIQPLHMDVVGVAQLRLHGPERALWNAS